MKRSKSDACVSDDPQVMDHRSCVVEPEVRAAPLAASRAMGVPHPLTDCDPPHSTQSLQLQSDDPLEPIVSFEGEYSFLSNFFPSYFVIGSQRSFSSEEVTSPIGHRRPFAGWPQSQAKPVFELQPSVGPQPIGRGCLPPFISNLIQFESPCQNVGEPFTIIESLVEERIRSTSRLLQGNRLESIPWQGSRTKDRYWRGNSRVKPDFCMNRYQPSVTRYWWDVEGRVGVMKALLQSKFDQNRDLRVLLMLTGRRPIIYGLPPWTGDRYWGMIPKEPSNYQLSHTVLGWTGINWLGRLLMDIRASYWE